MQVNLNPSVNHARPQFKALKGIIYSKDIKNQTVKRNLLKMFDNKQIQEFFKRHDGIVDFSNKRSYGPPSASLWATLHMYTGLTKEPEFLREKREVDWSKEMLDHPDITKKLFDFICEGTIQIPLGGVQQALTDDEIIKYSDTPTTLRLADEFVDKIINKKFDNDNGLEKLEALYKEGFDMKRMSSARFNEFVLQQMKEQKIEEQAAKDVENKLKELFGE